jgi:signal transduction histidine kinase
MSASSVFRTVRHLALLVLMATIWLLLAMVYFKWSVRPFDNVLNMLMPWERLFDVTPESTFKERLDFMQGLLEASDNIADAAFLMTAVSFAVFSIYLTLIYQQKQKRARENRLLMIKNWEIARRNEFIRYISATIGHEFKNNLGRIKRRLDLVDVPHEVKDRLDTNLEKLFADIEIFKKISDEREAGLIEFESVKIKDMILALSKQYSDLVDVSYQGGLVDYAAIYASPSLLRTVFENLMDNAVKYKKPEQERAKVTLSCSLDLDGMRRYVSLSFKDAGLGMDEYQADKCFYKGKGSGEGWGQGLYFAKYVVGLHAGKIRVGKDYTAPGVGTEIIIKLPFVEEAVDV